MPMKQKSGLSYSEGPKNLILYSKIQGTIIISIYYISIRESSFMKALLFFVRLRGETSPPPPFLTHVAQATLIFQLIKHSSILGARDFSMLVGDNGDTRGSEAVKWEGPTRKESAKNLWNTGAVFHCFDLIFETAVPKGRMADDILTIQGQLNFVFLKQVIMLSSRQSSIHIRSRKIDQI